VPYEITPEAVRPKYHVIPGWNSRIDDLKKRENLPNELINYINFIENEVNVPVGIVSVGPDREQTIKLK
jgi:adenylosuccinate synthase